MSDDPAFALSAAGEAVRAGDPDRFDAALFADDATRERLFTLYAYNLEAARAPWKASEPQIGAMRLRFWLDVIERAYDGQTPLAHEIAEPLHVLIQETRPDRALLEALATARLRDTDPEPIKDLGELDGYLADTAGALTRLSAFLCLPPETPESERATVDGLAKDIGHAQGVARLLEASIELAGLGRVMLPATDEAPLDGPVLARGETNDAWRRAARAVAKPALERLRAARRQRRAVPASVAPAFLSAWRAERVLKAALKPDLDFLSDFGPESPFRRRASLLWRGMTGRW